MINFENRVVPWNSLGKKVKNDKINNIVKQAGLDWNVEQHDVYINSKKAYGYKANVRDNDETILGIVSSKYQVIQNEQAFSFIDELIDEGLELESAGELKNGKRVWLMSKLPDIFIADDEITPYICFINNHDGKGGVRVAVTPIRVACANALNIAINQAYRSWSTKHMGNIENKIEEAKRTLNFTQKYIYKFQEKGNELINKKIDKNDVEELTAKLVPFPEQDKLTERKKVNIEEKRQELLYHYNNAPDLEGIRDTAWGFLNAVSSFALHARPKRETKTYQSRLFERVLNGHNVIDNAYKLVA